LSPVPNIGEVAGKAARDDEQRVDADFIAAAGIARRQPLGSRDPAQTVLVERPGGRFFGAALLDLDKSQRAAAPGDQVDFTAGHACPASQNAPAMEAQPPGADRLRLAATRFGKLAVQLPPPNSSARA